MKSSVFDRAGKKSLVNYASIAKLVPESLRLNSDVEQLDRPLHVVLLGDGLIERESTDAYVETELTRLLDHHVVFRNLGWSGDTVAGSARVEFGPGEYERSSWQRPQTVPKGYGFLKLLAQIEQIRPDVLIIAYGAEVAFRGDAGNPPFQTGLQRLLETLTPTGVRIVLMAPPPREVSRDLTGTFPEQNRLLGEVSRHLAQVAKSQKIPFVDLFHDWTVSTEDAYTDNGIHLNARGYQTMARLVAGTLVPTAGPWRVEVGPDGSRIAAVGTTHLCNEKTEYGCRWQLHDKHLPSVAEPVTGTRTAPRKLRIASLAEGRYSLDIDGHRVARGTAAEWDAGIEMARGPDFERLEQLRQAIARKNRLFFYHFRPQNKAYIELFRRHERGHHAAEIARFSLLVREAEADITRWRIPVPRVYELVREKNYPEHEVPADNISTDVSVAQAAFSVPAGFEMELFASEPMIGKPICMHWDERGRMWLATSTIYPHLQPGQVPNDQILVLEDVDRDGRADTRTVFADQLLVPHSVIPGNGGAYVAQSTDLLFLNDRDGDGQADERRTVLTGFGNADVHHMIHALRWGPDGDLYFNQSIYINSVVETPWGIRESYGACVWRLRPETLQLQIFSQGLVNPWGHAFDAWGQSFATDGAGGGGIAYLFPGSAFATHNYAGRELASLNPGRPKECGLECLSGRHVPPSWQGTWLTNDFRANRVTGYRLTASESGYQAEFLGELVSSSHRSFRPVDIKMGPDGAIYIADWYNPIIDHGEVDFHHPHRDRRHGRIWRLKFKDSPIVVPPRFTESTIPQLLDALLLPELWTRDQARRLLRERGSTEVIPALRQWLATAEVTRSEPARLQALWVYQGLRSPEPELLRDLLKAADPRVRAAAVRVLGDWHSQIEDATELLSLGACDPHPQVRLEAINGLRGIGTLSAVEGALQAVDLPHDANLEFALFRTAHELRHVWLPELRKGQPLFDAKARRLAFALISVGKEGSLEPLAKLVRSGQVSADQLVDTLVVLGQHGAAAERTLVVDHLVGRRTTDQQKILTALIHGGRDRHPVKNGSIILELLNSHDDTVRELALRLCGRWGMTESTGILKKTAADPTATPGVRRAAGTSLIEIDGEDGESHLRDLLTRSMSADARASADVRASAIAVLAGRPHVDMGRTAVEFLARQASVEHVPSIVAAFMMQKNGAQQLLAALPDVRLPAGIAQEMIDRVRLSGQESAQLIDAIRAADQSRVDVVTATHLHSEADIKAILAAVLVQGDPQRGAKVYQKKQLQCVTCHAIGGVGGQVGPDLSGLGGSARLADILQSILDPSAAIKDGFQTLQVITLDGQVRTGILHRQSDSHLVLRDGQNELITIPLSDIDERHASKISIMPTGLTDELSRQEIIDLLRYLSSLGRNGPS